MYSLISRSLVLHPSLERLLHQVTRGAGTVLLTYHIAWYVLMYHTCNKCTKSTFGAVQGILDPSRTPCTYPSGGMHHAVRTARGTWRATLPGRVHPLVYGVIPHIPPLGGYAAQEGVSPGVPLQARDRR